jgi:ADP-heptose:LPS heptosyltransferase
MWHKFLMFISRQYLGRLVRRRPPAPLASLDLEKVRRVLLISATALGDTLFSTPAIRALKERFPDWSLEILGHRVFGELLVHNPYVDRVWFYPGRNRRLVALARNLGRRHYDLVIILHGNDPEATMLAALTGSPYIIGSDQSALASAYSATPALPDLYAHAIERRLDYVRLLGADTGDKRMNLYLPPEAVAAGEDLLTQHFGDPPPMLLALHPVGSSPYKSWPAANFIELGDYLYRAYGAGLIIISGSKDRSQAEALAGALAGPTLVTGGRYPLLIVAALLQGCRLLVANDSGPLHLGLALGTPTVALLGADHPARVGPYQVDWGNFLYKKAGVCDLDRCLTKKCPSNRCLQAIAVEEVVQLIQTWWEPRFRSGAAP